MIKRSSPQFNREMHGAKEEKTNRWSDGANVHTRARAHSLAHTLLTEPSQLCCF